MNDHNLDAMIERAGEATEPPPPPLKGIPKQWLPAWIRQPIRWFLLPFILLDLAMQKVAKKMIKPPFKQEGKCLKRGNCCHYILIRASKNPFGYLFYLWATQINGFYLRSHKLHFYEGKKMYIMGCRHLKKDGSCAQYKLRPLVCRQWPVIERFGYPKILKGCGFRSNPPYPNYNKKDKLNFPSTIPQQSHRQMQKH